MEVEDTNAEAILECPKCSETFPHHTTKENGVIASFQFCPYCGTPLEKKEN